MKDNCRHCGRSIRVEAEGGTWVHTNGLAICDDAFIGTMWSEYAEPREENK